ncbi:hypothetical protein BDZ89DRAFT_963413 [Hymenopellis radicata]|nr:hypothetical protein BDZ89DRAFT_963413 [Hymenopellis radicata]
MPAYKPPPPPQPSPSKSAKTPKPKTPAKSKEKRQARFKSAAPQAILQRLDRVASQRFFMVDREREGDELKEVFSVLGSTGNIYKVTIDHLPRCDCPDFQKGNHCKHIIFIFTKVLQVPSHSTHWYQKALLTEELEEVFNNAPLAPNALANERVREAYARATGKTPKAASTSQSQKTRKVPGEDDDCPICYESMHKQPEAKLEWCEECGNALHKECFGQWRTTQRNAGKKLTCVWCRADWVSVGGAAGAGAEARVGAGGYLNLSQAAGLSPQRDTSSYYMGPRRGQRFYGYQSYEDD